MKKLLIFMLVLGMASTASAALISSTQGYFFRMDITGPSTTPTPGDTLTIEIFAGDTVAVGAMLDTVLNISDAASIGPVILSYLCCGFICPVPNTVPDGSGGYNVNVNCTLSAEIPVNESIYSVSFVVAAGGFVTIDAVSGIWSGLSAVSGPLDGYNTGSGMEIYGLPYAGVPTSFPDPRPLIGLSSTTFDFLHLGTNPDDQILSIFNAEGGQLTTLNWQISYDCDWLTVDPNSGSSNSPDQPNDVTLSVDVSGLAYGSYNCELTISAPGADNSPQTVYVNLNLLCPGDVTATVTGYIPASPFPLPGGTQAYFGGSNLWEGPDGKVDTCDLQSLIYLLVWEGVGLVVTPVPAEAAAADVTGTVTGYIPASPFPLPGGTPASFDSALWTGPDGKIDNYDLQSLIFLLQWDGTDLVYTCP